MACPARDTLIGVIIEHCLLDPFQYRKVRSRGVPGEVIASLSPERRAQLQALRSEDIAPGKGSRWAAWADCYQWQSELGVRRLKLEFDQKVLKLR